MDVVVATEGRTPLHYCASCQDPQACWGLVEGAGADQTIVDTRGHVAAYYLDHPEELELPEVVHKFSGAPMKRFTSGKEGTWGHEEVHFRQGRLSVETTSQGIDPQPLTWNSGVIRDI
uniref:Uncharacterized protein n=1 Tax=Timema monikensis TaxID=170555 RepID=A0A7R9EBG3_9NEOP|nr:unnamed protein product [Timema monikensis]